MNKTTLRISPKTDLNVITGLITGMHESGTSHREILPALCSKADLEKGYEEALKRGYLGHEYGDLSLVRCS